MRNRIRFCAVCLKYSRYQAVENGFAKVREGRQLRIYAGDPVCLDHALVNDRGRLILIEEVEYELSESMAGSA